MSGTTRHDNNHAAERAQHEAQAAATAEKKAADAKAAKLAEPVSAEMAMLLLAVDWLHGDKHHYDVIRKAVLKILTDMGEDGAEAKARLETVRLAAAA
jgi:hypothetical protein